MSGKLIYLNNQHLNAYQYIHIRACFYTWGKARGVPDGQNYGWGRLRKRTETIISLGYILGHYNQKGGVNGIDMRLNAGYSARVVKSKRK
jgi:hypothetical protein